MPLCCGRCGPGTKTTSRRRLAECMSARWSLTARQRRRHSPNPWRACPPSRHRRQRRRRQRSSSRIPQQTLRTERARRMVVSGRAAVTGMRSCRHRRARGRLSSDPIAHGAASEATPGCSCRCGFLRGFSPDFYASGFWIVEAVAPQRSESVACRLWEYLPHKREHGGEVRIEVREM